MNMDSNGFECVFLFPWILRAFSGEVCVILLYHALTKSEYFFGWESVPLKFCERMSRMSIAILGDQIARDRRICTVSPPHEHLISPGSLKSLLATRWSWCWRVQRCCQPSKGTVLLKFFLFTIPARAYNHFCVHKDTQSLYSVQLAYCIVGQGVAVATSCASRLVTR